MPLRDNPAPAENGGMLAKNSAQPVEKSGTVAADSAKAVRIAETAKNFCG